MRKLFVFGLDDVLIFDAHHYDDALLEVPPIIISALGPRAPHAKAIIDLVWEIDQQRIREINLATGKPFHHSADRFPGSCIEAYLSICSRLGAYPDPSVEGLIYDVGTALFDESRYRRSIVPGAKDVLDFLAAQGDTLVLLTSGDWRVQRMKVEALKAVGIDHFSTIIITAGPKTSQMFRDIRGYSPDPGGLSPISVGNSFTLDVIPALAVGYRGIYIPMWSQDDPEQPESQMIRSGCSVFFPDLCVFADLRQIIDFYGGLP